MVAIFFLIVSDPVLNLDLDLVREGAVVHGPGGVHTVAAALVLTARALVESPVHVASRQEDAAVGQDLGLADPNKGEKIMLYYVIYFRLRHGG